MAILYQKFRASFIKRAQGGNATAALLLGGMFETGRGVKKDEAEAKFWLGRGTV